MTMTAARDRLIRPYAPENAASLRRKAAKPKDMLGWFVIGFRAELPEQLHASGVWRDYVHDDEDRIGEGGSLLGTPRTADAFRAYLEGDPLLELEMARLTEAGVTVAEEAYRFPMRAALARLAGRGHRDDPFPFMGRCLFRTACMDGDWDVACRSMGINPRPVRWPYMVAALDRLWDRYAEEPPARYYHDKGVAGVV
jgi:hypothetical protein